MQWMQTRQRGASVLAGAFHETHHVGRLSTRLAAHWRAHSGASRRLRSVNADEHEVAAELKRLHDELDEARASYANLEHAFAQYKMVERIPHGKSTYEYGDATNADGGESSTTSAAHPAEYLLDHRFANSDARRRKMRILSMDGGGARGLYTASILARIVREEPRLLNSIDLIAGTSTGAVIGMLLASDFPPDEIEAIFQTLAPKVFAPMPWWRRMASPFFTSSYDSQVRSKIFDEWCAGRTFADVKKWLLITTFKVDGTNPHPAASIFPSNCNRWRPGLLTNIPRMQGLVEPDLPLTLHDTLMWATAAPVYFPIENGYIDGGVFANNPSLCAMTRSLANIPQLTSKDVCVLSLGTGVRPMRLDIDTNGPLSWGLGKWAPYLVDLLFDSSNRTVNLHMAYLLGQRYHRLNPELDYDVALDDVSPKAFEMLRKKAEETDLTRTIEFIEEHFLTGEPPLWESHDVLSDWNPPPAWEQTDALSWALR